MANYLDLFRLIPALEGGLSARTDDRAATVPGNAGVPYHTNKGVQWATFKELAPQAGFVPTYDLFLQMPDHVLRAIFKVGFWNPLGGDGIRSQAVANQLVDWGWGSGTYWPAVRVQQLLNQRFGANLVVDGKVGPKTIAAINAAPEQQLVPALANARASFVDAIPGEANDAGWFRRIYELVPIAYRSALASWTDRVPEWAKKQLPRQRSAQG